MRFSLALMSFFALLTRGAPATAIIESDVQHDTVLFLQGRDPLSVTNFTGTHAAVVETILLHQILDAGGWEYGLLLYPSPSYKRTLRELATHHADLTGSTMWASDIAEETPGLKPSETMIPSGKYAVGFYVLQDNTNALSSTNRQLLCQLEALSSRHDLPEWEALTALAPSRIYHVARGSLKMQMLNSSRGDFMVLPFRGTSTDLSFTSQKLKFAPIPGLKMNLAGQRSYIFNKDSERYAELRACFSKGFNELQSSGRIDKAYKECGFYHPVIEGWTNLNQTKAEKPR